MSDHAEAISYTTSADMARDRHRHEEPGYCPSVTRSPELRGELAAFLRARRAKLSRAELGLPPAGRQRRRTIGLRREEVCTLSGVSVTWYTWLEQGRDINPSRQVLDALARTLRLSDTEHSYLLALCGYTGALAREPVRPAAPTHVQRLLDALEGNPAFALDDGWTVCAWNRAYSALYPHIDIVPADDRNLLWLTFTDPYVRGLLPDWENDSRRFLAEYRAKSAARPERLGHDPVIQRLLLTGEPFRTWWAQYDVEGFASRMRMFHHPSVGELTLEQHVLAPSDLPSLQLVVYLPAHDGQTPHRLRELVRHGARSSTDR